MCQQGSLSSFHNWKTKAQRGGFIVQNHLNAGEKVWTLVQPTPQPVGLTKEVVLPPPSPSPGTQLPTPSPSGKTVASGGQADLEEGLALVHASLDSPATLADFILSYHCLQPRSPSPSLLEAISATCCLPRSPSPQTVPLPCTELLVFPLS